MANSNRTLSDGEQKYRMLFNSIDAGFCVIEVLFDTNAKAVDFRFLETNPAFERQTGIAEAAGKTAREVLPNFGSGLLDLYGKIARTGIPARFDSFSEVLGRFYDVYAFRTGDPGWSNLPVGFRPSVCSRLFSRIISVPMGYSEKSMMTSRRLATPNPTCSTSSGDSNRLPSVAMRVIRL